MPPRPRARPAPAALALASLLLLFAPPLLASSSSERAPAPRAPPAPLDAAELVRDAPLYPPLQHASSEYEDLQDLSDDPETSIEDSNIFVTPELSDEDGDVTDIEDIQDIEDIADIPGDGDIEALKKSDNIEVLGQNSEPEDDGERQKRSSGTDWDKGSKNRRVQTADTILNIRGALRDAIGDAGAAPGPRASSRVDAFVVRPAAPHPAPPPPAPQAQPSTQAPKHRELLVEAHAPARLPCDLANATQVRWYRDSELVQLPTSSRGEAMWAEPGAAVIARATRADAALWRCAGKDAAGNDVSGKPTQLLIYEAVRSLYLAVDGRRLDAGNTWVPVRDKAALEVRCVAEGGVPPPELSWRLLALEPTLDHRPYLRVHPANYSREGSTWSLAAVTAARELHNATLQCDATQRRPPTARAPAELSAKLEIHVTYPPSFVISRWPGFGVALRAGGAAALRCDVDANPPARAWWRRDDAPPDSVPPLGGLERGSSASLRWAALSSAHGGWYRCRASWLDHEYSSIGYYLNVLASEETSSMSSGASEAEDEEGEEVDHQKVDVPVGGNVQLHCPKGSVGCWWRRVLGNASEAWAPAGSHHAHGVLGIKEALYQEGGEYRCVGARGADLARLRELKRVTLRVTGGATARVVSAAPAAGGWRLECGACGRGVRVRWVLRGRALPAALAPDLQQHCWRAVLHVPEPDEVLRLECGACGRGVRVRWVLRGRALPAALAPDLQQHCWRAVLHVPEPDEVLRLECGACGRGVRVRWVLRGRALPAALAPDLQQHCWRAVLHVPEPDEVLRLECGACGRGVRVRWVLRGRALPAALAPDLQQHCWRAVLHVPEPDEVLRLECGACGRGVRVRWVLRGRALPAALAPDLQQHCWRAVLHVPEPDEVLRLECGACGRGVRVRWVLRGRALPAALAPDLQQHCWRAVLHVPEPDEVWCVAGGANGGAVAVFPSRGVAPARHATRALHACAPPAPRALAATLALALLATCP